MNEPQSLQDALNKARRNLAILEEQAAGFGSLHIPAHLQIELEDKRREVAELEQHIEAIKKGLQNNPYRGLSAFREKDAPFFFGRESFIEQLYLAVKQKQLIAVVGSSGSGKSSVVFAGLLPRLQQEAGWLVISFRPGEQPFQSLASALTPLRYVDLDIDDQLEKSKKLAAKLYQKDFSLSDVINQIVEKSQRDLQLLLVVDQFEELYTLTKEAGERQKFLDMLLSTLNSKTTSLKLVLTLRADFFNAALSYRPLSDALQTAQQNLGPMKSEELRQAIVKPAQDMGMRFEGGLVERILEAVSNQSGDLPLLEFALTELWERQAKGELTNKAYDAIGGVEGALARHADEVYAKLSEAEQKRLQRVFTQLVQPGAGTEDTRRRATKIELGEENWGLVADMATARLVVTSNQAVTEKVGQEGGNETHDTVEIIHEALIGKWERFRGWMAADREFRMWQEELRRDLHRWENKKGELLSGVTLAVAAVWLEKRGEDLSKPERSYIEAGVALRDREQRRESELERQRADTAEALLQVEKRERKRQRSYLRRISISLLFAIATTLVAGFQWNEATRQTETANNQKAEAQRQAIISKSQSLSAYAQNQLEIDPALSVLLATKATRLANSPDTLEALPQADNALRQALSRPWLRANLIGHTKNVNSAVFSPDGKQILTASGDDTVRLWNAVDGKPIATLSDHTGWIYSAVFSPDGKQILTIRKDNTLGLWNAEDGKLLAIFTGHTDRVNSVVFSFDGKEILTASGDGTARLWNVADGKPIATLSDHTGWMLSAVFSPDGKQILTASVDKTAKLWDSIDGKLLYTLIGHTDNVNSAVFSPDGKQILTASYDGTAKLWSAMDGKLFATLSGYNSSMSNAVFSPDGRQILTTSSDNTVVLWNAADGKPLIGLMISMLRSAVFSPDGKQILTTSENNNAWLWNVPDLKLLNTLADNTSRANNAIFSPDGRQILTIRKNNTLGLWNLTDKKLMVTLTGHTDTVNSAVFSPDGKQILTASVDKTAKLWDSIDGKLLYTLIGHTDNVNSAVFSPDGKQILTASADKTARLWSTKEGTEISTLTGHANNVFSAVFSTNGKQIFTAGKDSFLVLWNTADSSNPKVLFTPLYGGDINSVALSPDGNQVLTAGGKDKPIALWSWADSKLLVTLTGHTDSVNSAVFSPDGKQILTASADKTARLWSAEDGRLLAILSGHTGIVYRAVFSPDGKQILTTSQDKTTRLWNAVDGKLLATRAGHTSGVTSAVFSPDGKQILTASYDNTVIVQPATIEELLKIAESRTPRSLTEEERQRFGL